MTLNIRLEGFPNEVDRMIELLGSNSSLIEVDRVSRGYANRDSTTIRRYLAIQFVTDEKLGVTRHVPLCNIVSEAKEERL